MKKMMIALIATLTIAAQGKAMSYEQARNEALFLTDKMAYELNLTDEQYEAAYEINLDYLMGVSSYDDVYGDYWERRNRDLSYVLLDAQWQAYIAASYFYRPLYWSAGYWHFGVYARYPHRDYFYFGRPAFYATYRGAHAWHLHGSHGYYYSRRHHFRPAGHAHYGMLDRWNRGDYRHHHGGTMGHSGTRGRLGGGTAAGHDRGTTGRHNGTTERRHEGIIRNMDNGQRYSDFSKGGGPRTSSTRTTVNNDRGISRSSGAFSRNRTDYSGGSRNSGSFSGSRSNSGSGASRGSNGSGSRSSGSFGSRR